MPSPGDEKRRVTGSIVATEDASRLRADAGNLLEGGLGVEWYVQAGNDADRAALNLCRLRRARAGQSGGPRHGDEAVRQVLGEVSTPALVWLASRAISYMDENGFPEAVAPWFREDDVVVG
jgi:hypothetical protein